MNILGHSYVASKVAGRLNKYLVAGSHLPDLVPFVPNSVFTFAEIHESSDKLLKFLEEEHPDTCDLAIGMMAHSVKFGADKFNQEIGKWLLGDNEKLINELGEKIADCSSVSFEVAKQSRLHNYLWVGVDVYLLKTNLEFVEQLANLHRQLDRKEIANLLSLGFGKDYRAVKRMIDYLLVPIRPELLVSLVGLVKIWKIALAGLPEKDKIDEKKTVKLFWEIYQRFENQWQEILERVVSDVRSRMLPYLGTGGRGK